MDSNCNFPSLRSDESINLPTNYNSTSFHCVEFSNNEPSHEISINHFVEGSAEAKNDFFGMECRKMEYSIPDEKINESPMEECPICFDKIGGINNCTTQCGHVFCFKCIAESMSKDTRCPFCRQELVESKSNDTSNPSDSETIENVTQDGSDDDDDDDDWNTYDEDNSEDQGDLGNIETIVERFTKQGYTIFDAIMILTERSSKINETYNEEYLSQITNKFEEIMEELDNETYECNLMQEEDLNSYSLM
jgi:hypothetical protein